MDHGGIQGSVMLSPRSSQLRAPRIAERLRLTQRSCQERIHFSFLVPISAMWLQSPKNQLNSFHKPKTVSLFELEIERRHILNGILYLSSAEHTVGVWITILTVLLRITEMGKGSLPTESSRPKWLGESTVCTEKKVWSLISQILWPLSQDEVLKRTEVWSMRSLASSCSPGLSFELLCIRRVVLNLPYLVAGVAPSRPISHSVIWVPRWWMTLTCSQTPCWIVPRGLSVSPKIIRPEESAHPNPALIPKKKTDPVSSKMKWHGNRV